ncbi:hypothetical protein F4782DRAFT_546712 [Xylaria castorea]|nr:hypothetical protein F4782DRAFT_546712 [Xylaria castorea]
MLNAFAKHRSPSREIISPKPWHFCGGTSRRDRSSDGSSISIYGRRPVPNHPQPSGQAPSALATANRSTPTPATTTNAAAGPVSNSSSLSVQASVVPANSNTNGAVTINDSSSGTAVHTTILKISIAKANNNIATTSNSPQGTEKSDAQHLPDDVHMANSDKTNVAGDPSKVARGPAADSSAGGMDSNEGIENDVQHDVHMQTDNDETGSSAELDKEEVQYNHNTASVAGDESEGPPSKKRKFNA